MQTQNRILQAILVLLALILLVGVADAQKKKTKKTTPTILSSPDSLQPVRRMPPEESYIGIDAESPVRSVDEPLKSEFVAVEVEPHPTQDIRSLIEYPEEAKKAGLEGKVILSALIDKNGKVIKVEVDRSTNPIFEESARKAIMKTQFKPALQNRQPVKLWYTLPIVYKLNKDSNTYRVEAPIQTRKQAEVATIPPSLEYNPRYNFISIDVEPQPLQDIYRLVEYPDEAKKAGLEGRVVLYALIDTSGKVIQVEVENSDNSIFDESARKGMLKVQFTPAMKDGKAVQYWYTMPVLFKLYTIGQ